MSPRETKHRELTRQADLMTPIPVHPPPCQTERGPLMTTEKAAHAQQQQARPRCVDCSQALLLIQPGRDRCERCQPTDWRIVSGRAQ